MNATIKNEIDQLRHEAMNYLSEVAKMDITTALKRDEHGYEPLRRIYEREGEPGTWLFPNYHKLNRKSEEYQARYALYQEFSSKSTDLFWKLAVSAEGPSTYTEQQLADLQTHAWNQGHATGYNSIFEEYEEAVGKFEDMQSGKISDEEYNNFLDI